MNSVISYVVRLAASANSNARGAVPIRVPDGKAFRVRHIEFRLQGLQASDHLNLVSVSRLNQEPLRTSTQLETSNHLLAFYGFTLEVQTSGLATLILVHRVALWDYDFRLVMQPTAHLFSVQLADIVDVEMAGELVNASEGERNAIIAWQGGVPKNG